MPANARVGRIHQTSGVPPEERLLIQPLDGTFRHAHKMRRWRRFVQFSGRL